MPRCAYAQQEYMGTCMCMCQPVCSSCICFFHELEVQVTDTAVMGIAFLVLNMQNETCFRYNSFYLSQRHTTNQGYSGVKFAHRKVARKVATL